MQVAPARLAALPGWINMRTTVGLLLFGISLLSGSLLLQSAERGVLVWVAARDLPEGQRLSVEHVEAVQVDLPGSQLANYLGRAASVSGSTLLRPVRRGELIPAGWVTERYSEPIRAIAVPITSDHAVGGALRPGDRVDVFATLRTPGGGAETTLLVQEAEVEGLLRSDGFTMEDEEFGGITLSVSPEQVAKIAFALRTGEIDIVRVEGSAGTGHPTSVTARDL